MKVAVARFPGSNCDQDALYSLREDIGVQAEYVWHGDSSLAGFDAVFIPGGFTYGDYLRCGAIASRSPILSAVSEFAKSAKPVIGVCNGFQILCEAGLLPGALLRNAEQLFVCAPVHLRAENRTSLWTQGVDRILEIPIAHGEGRYVCDEATLERLKDEDRVAFRYVGPNGERGEAYNPNGSTDDIAGVLNEKGNVLGMMPHPERATRSVLGLSDGQAILKALTLVGV
ncbi:MAG TPA: phosphoribosylformylglycinamidine synthase subunit PurQ [Fimbriimonadaceae bacterium]|nr:phosphoribosylformylglycinamidine synthase subunit PurQ [Fimbriimonadaceae bacterium]